MCQGSRPWGGMGGLRLREGEESLQPRVFGPGWHMLPSSAPGHAAATARRVLVPCVRHHRPLLAQGWERTWGTGVAKGP